MAEALNVGLLTRLVRLTRAVADTLRMHAASLLMRAALRVFFPFEADAEEPEEPDEFEDPEDREEPEAEDRGDKIASILLFEAQDFGGDPWQPRGGLKNP
jgi:hypothetical protein